MRNIVILLSALGLTLVPTASAEAADRQPPTITITRPSSTVTYALKQTVRASYSCRDNRLVRTCSGTVPNGSPIKTSTAGNHVFSVTATDWSGNRSTKQVVYKVAGAPPPPNDITPPTIAITSPTPNATYAVGQSATAQFTCSDTGGTGVVECSGSVPNGQPLATSQPGTYSFTVRARDAAGNVADRTVQYTVQQASPPGACTGYYGLTFDDGPDAVYTPQVRDALASLGVRATFFMAGQNVDAAPQLAKSVVDAGHWVGNHSYTHPDLTTLSATQVRDQLSRTNTAIRNATGVVPQFVRPPYGAFNDQTLGVFREFNLENAFWTVDTNDWQLPSVATLVAEAVKVKDRGIILMHDAYPNTVSALPQIVNQLKQKGLCPGKLAVSPTPVEAFPAWPGVFFSVVAVKP
jgi:Polysaccharide deacetylase